MAFWGVLGNILKGALGGIGGAASGAAKGAEADRMNAAEYALGRDRLGLQGAGQYEGALQDRAQLDLARRQQTQSSGTNAFQNALRSSLAMNFAPASRPSGVPNISFVGKGIGAQGQSAAEAMNREAMIRLLEGEKFDALPEATPYQFSAPAQMPKASTMEKLLGILGLGATAAGGMLKKPPQGLDPGVYGDG